MALIDQINTLNGWAIESRILLWGLEDDLDMRSNSAYNLSMNGGIGWVAWANRAVLVDLIKAVQYFVYGYSSSFNYSYWYDVHLGLSEAGGEITWKAICEAWAVNNFEGKEWTISFIDHMRKLMWDEPYNITWASDPSGAGE